MMNLKISLIIVVFLVCGSISAQYKVERVLSIDTIFALLAQNSTQLKLSEANVATAKQAIDVASSKRLPALDLGLSAMYLGDATLMDRDFTNVQTAPMPHFGNNFSIEASYIVFAGGDISNTISKTKLEAQVAQLAHKKRTSDMKFLVAGFYLELYKLSNQRKVFRKNIDQTQLLIDQVKAKQNEGMALANDLTRYELMLQNLQLAEIEVVNSYRIINQQLVVVLGLPVETVIIADTTIQNREMAISTNDELLRIAIENRPEMIMASCNSAIASKQINLAKASYYPSLAIVAADNFEGPITFEVPPIDKNFNYWYVGVGLRYNLASLYKSKDEVRLARSHQNMTQYAEKAEMEQTQTAVQSAQIKYLESFDKLHTYEKMFQLATENYGIINNRYMNGLALITEMLDASNMKLNAELQVVNANLNVIYNHYKLLLETGQL